MERKSERVGERERGTYPERMSKSKILHAQLPGGTTNTTTVLYHNDPRVATQEVCVGASHAEKPRGVNAELLQKIWRIDSETAKRTIKTTSQLNRQDVNSKLSRNFGTNDRMLRYRRIKSFFFTDTFYVTKKAASSRGYTCMQIFVSDMGYVFLP